MRTTRDTLIEVAARLVDEGGEAAVTLREVGARAGLSHNAPYKHFADKRDLLATVAAVELRNLATRIARAVAPCRTGIEQVRASARVYLEWAQANPVRFKLVFGQWGTEPHDELDAAAAEATSVMYNCVAAAVADRTLRGDPDRIAPMVWSLGHGAVDLNLADHLRKKPGAPTPEQLVDDLIDLLGAG
ncbi:TetR/AcrR family transcriptional regulator [Nocardia sp. NPDC050710]|uniref:TetR/AcrR family transcriptional regulator n=1 Tax=Nocardia sp. NPDC050710 TaxID=3157220 RepID=UPI0033E6C68A